MVITQRRLGTFIILDLGGIVGTTRTNCGWTKDDLCGRMDVSRQIHATASPAKSYATCMVNFWSRVKSPANSLPPRPRAYLFSRHIFLSRVRPSRHIFFPAISLYPTTDRRRTD